MVGITFASATRNKNNLIMGLTISTNHDIITDVIMILKGKESNCNGQ